MQYQCPHCKEGLTEDAIMAGACPHCNKVIDFAMVQKIEEKQPEPVPETKEPAKEEPEKAKSISKKKSKKKGLWEILTNNEPTKTKNILAMVIVAIFFVYLFAFLSNPSEEEQLNSRENRKYQKQEKQETEKKLSQYDEQIHRHRKAGIAEIEKEEGMKVVNSLTYARTSEERIWWYLDVTSPFKSMAEGFARNWCEGFHKDYPGQWVTVYVEVDGRTGARAEYSPVSDRIVVK